MLASHTRRISGINASSRRLRGTAQRRIALLGYMAPVPGGGNLQYLADRLDPVGVAMLVDELS
jgi:hypothetical protein